MDKRLLQLSKWIASQLKQDRDVVIIISGPERAGKSSCSYWVGKGVSYYTKRDFSLNNFVWHGDEMVKKLWTLPEESALINDEAGLDLYKRESTTKMNRKINKSLMVSGLRKQCVTLCVPSMWDLDKFMSQRRALVWIEVKLGYDGETGKLIRGFGTVRSHLEQATWDTKAYWATAFDIKFDDMPYDFKIAYKKKKKAETKKRIDELTGENGETAENVAEQKINMALDVRKMAELCQQGNKKFTDKELRKILKKYDVKDKSYFYEVKKKH